MLHELPYLTTSIPILSSFTLPIARVMKFFFLRVDIARLLCYPLHTGILGYPRTDPVGDISHQFSATHAIISLLSALKDVTVSCLLQTPETDCP